MMIREVLLGGSMQLFSFFLDVYLEPFNSNCWTVLRLFLQVGSFKSEWHMSKRLDVGCGSNIVTLSGIFGTMNPNIEKRTVLFFLEWCWKPCYWLQASQTEPRMMIISKCDFIRYVETTNHLGCEEATVIICLCW